DIAPPADHAVGRYALVLCVIGYAAGLAKPESGQLRSAAGPMMVVVCAAIGTTLLYAGVGSIVGDQAGAHVGLVQLVCTATLYDRLLAPFVVPLVIALARRFDNDPLADDPAGGFGGIGPRNRMKTSRTGLSPQRGRFGRAGRMVRTTSSARGA